jgi:hypothetical protein
MTALPVRSPGTTSLSKLRAILHSWEAPRRWAAHCPQTLPNRISRGSYMVASGVIQAEDQAWKNP